MSGKILKWFLLICIFINNLVFTLVYNMSFMMICLVDFILYESCAIVYHIIFNRKTEQNRKEIIGKND